MTAVESWLRKVTKLNPCAVSKYTEGQSAMGGQEGPAATTKIIAGRGRAGEGVAGAGEADAGAVQLDASGDNSEGEGESVGADASSQEKRDGDAEEDELMVRAEEFIQRMNRAWRTENVCLC